MTGFVFKAFKVKHLNLLLETLENRKILNKFDKFPDTFVA